MSALQAWVVPSVLLLGLIPTRSAQAQGEQSPAPPRVLDSEAKPVEELQPVEAEDVSSEAGAANPSESERLTRVENLAQAQQAQLDAQQQQIDQLEQQNKQLQEQAATNEELVAEVLNAENSEAVALEDRLRIYGFADMAFTKRYIPDGSWQRNLIDNNSTFALGNVNVYLDAKPAETFRVLSEIRFTLYPHGSYQGSLTPTDSSVYDITSATGRNRVIASAIVIERAWIEWEKFDAFSVRTGYFLTPYGIWNVDHGSPTLISSVLPSFWAEEYFPTRQLGVQILGSVFRGEMEYGYRAWIGNGRMTSQVDLDFNKHFGGRAYVSYNAAIRAQLGVSGFWGRQTESVKTVDLTSPTFAVTKTDTVQYDEYGLAADLSLDVDALRIRAEYVMNRTQYSDGLRPRTPSGNYEPDRIVANVYGIAAYRLPWLNLEPFVYVEYASRPTAFNNASAIYSGGIIEHIRAGIQFKFQGYFVHFPNDDEFPDANSANFPGWDMRLVSIF